MKEARVVLITGGAGFIGTNLVHYWIKKHKNDRVIVFDSLTYAGNLENLSGLSERYKNRYDFIKGDISNRKDISKILLSYPITHIINIAAETHVDNSIKMPERFFKSNIKGVFTILEEIRKSRKNIRLIQVSTDEVYGELGNSGYFTEKSPIKPSSPYSASKAGGDLLCLAYYRTYKLDIVITRCCNNYGPFQHHEKLIPLMIKNALSGRPLPVYGMGLNIRDWIYVEDHCRAIDLVLRKGKSGEVYNIGVRHEMKNIDIVKIICKTLASKINPEKLKQLLEDPTFRDRAGRAYLAGRHEAIKDVIGQLTKMDIDKEKFLSLITFVKDRPGHDWRYAIDPAKIMKLGFNPKITFEEGIRNTVKWYLKKWGNRA